MAFGPTQWSRPTGLYEPCPLLELMEWSYLLLTVVEIHFHQALVFKDV